MDKARSQRKKNNIKKIIIKIEKWRKMIFSIYVF